MRILHIHKYYHDQDGASRYMIDVMRLQERAGHVVAPFAMHDPRNLPSAWDQYFVSTLDTQRFQLGLASLRQLGRALWSREAKRKLETLLQVFKPDVVHVHNIYTHLSPSVLAACRAYGVPVVMTVHDYALISANYSLWDARQAKSVSPTSGWLAIAKTRFIKGSWLATFMLDGVYRLHRALGVYDRVIEKYLPPSQAVKSSLVAAGYAADKIEAVPLFAGNLLDESWRPTTDNARAGVLYAGRFEDYKGIDLFLQAAEAFPNTQFYVAGTGPLEHEVIEASQNLSNLQYLGFVPGVELWRKMSEVQLVIVPSRWAEPGALVVIEAMACGTAVLASDSGGSPEKIKAGVNGVIFKSGDAQDLLAKLKQLLKQPEDLQRMGEGARRYAKAQADPNKHVSRLIELYDSILIHK